MPLHRQSMRFRAVRADDYAEPLASMIRRGDIEPPDDLVALDRFDAPGCQMCGAPEDDPCDCHDPQESE